MISSGWRLRPDLAIAVDYDNDFARTPRDSAGVYAEIIRAGIGDAMWAQHRGSF